MNFLRWKRGRQEGSYYKMALLPAWLSKALNADAYFLKFPDKCSVMKHMDPVAPGYKHYRMNITIKRSDNKYDKMYILGPIRKWWRFEIFRPDKYFHGLKPITGSIIMLSLGCRIKE